MVNLVLRIMMRCDFAVRIAAYELDAQLQAPGNIASQFVLHHLLSWFGGQ